MPGKEKLEPKEILSWSVGRAARVTRNAAAIRQALVDGRARLTPAQVRTLDDVDADMERSAQRLEYIADQVLPKKRLGSSEE